MPSRMKSKMFLKSKMAPHLELLAIKFIQLERRFNFRTYWALPSQMAMPRNASLVPERSHVVAFLR